MANKVDTHLGLLQQRDLRLQHPDWIQTNQQCPMCDSYDARLIELLSRLRALDDEDLQPLWESPAQTAVIRVYDEAGNVIETHEYVGEFKEP